MTSQTQSQDQLSSELNKTDFGHLIYENRKVVMAGLVAALVAVMGWVLWKQSKESSAMNNSVEVFEFQAKNWTDAKAGKATPQDLVKQFDGLRPEIQKAPVMLPIVLEMGKFLYDKGMYAEAESILAKAQPAGDNQIQNFFLSMQRAVVLEKLGQTDKAIALYEDLLKGKEPLLPARVAVELGRLYLQKGEKGKAQTQFDYVINSFPNDEQAKMAKLYLSQLAQ